MLQSRPITNLDNSFSEYEIIHERDDGHQSESEIFSRLHVAETFPRSTSYSYDFYFGKGTESLFYVTKFIKIQLIYTSFINLAKHG